MSANPGHRLHAAEAAIAILFVVGGLVAYLWLWVAGLGTARGGVAPSAS